MILERRTGKLVEDFDGFVGEAVDHEFVVFFILIIMVATTSNKNRIQIRQLNGRVPSELDPQVFGIFDDGVLGPDLGGFDLEYSLEGSGVFQLCDLVDNSISIQNKHLILVDRLVQLGIGTHGVEVGFLLGVLAANIDNYPLINNSIRRHEFATVEIGGPAVDCGVVGQV